ncbi:hypothetical protein [Litoribacillus peritrichatus]|uniref:DUF4785 domain-containing protein n=1 Tax=Litoribacillus peritrichatus TaxID=718191 RepID=A0ABP7MED4_9GAMM
MKSRYWLLPVVALFLAWLGYDQKDQTITASKNIKPIESANPVVTDTHFGFSDHNEPTLKSAVKLQAKTPQHPIERLRFQAQKTQLQQALIEDFDNYKRYPPENRRFVSEAQDPLTQRYSIDERTTLNEEQSLGLTLWSNKKYYLQDDEVSIHAFIQDVDGNKLASDFSTEVIFNHKNIGQIALVDNEGDRHYTALIDLANSSLDISEPGIYKVLIHSKEHSITDAITFTVSKPDIQLTGSFRDKLTSDGNLVIEAEVDVEQSSRFYIQGSLYSSTNIAVGTTQVSQSFDKGRHWVELNFSGLMIQDAKENGPFVLKKLSLAKASMPMQRAPLEKPEYMTDAYTLDEFAVENQTSKTL